MNNIVYEKKLDNKTEQLSRSLGLPMLTFYGCGMILGAGIYSIIGKAAGIAEGTLDAL